MRSLDITQGFNRPLSEDPIQYSIIVVTDLAKKKKNGQKLPHMACSFFTVYKFLDS